jgi:two-component system, sensor histidine kinase and response regulator
MSVESALPVKLLLVDDLEENLLALSALLRADGVELLTASSGREALELLLTHEVALALLDVQMPEMDGFELAELMRGAERTRHVPIIFVTAGARDPQRVFQGYDAGAVDFLFKPIAPQILQHKVDFFIQLHRQQKALAETLRLNEELMAVVGHDLRSPLSVILMTANMLEQTSKEPTTRQVAVRLRSSGKRMLRIIDELFDLSRARLGGGIPIERRPTDLHAVARAAVAEFDAMNTGCSIVLHHEGELTGEWDAGRLGQVLSNLIGNAVRHGLPATPVDVRLEGREDGVRFSVHNAGSIAPDILPRIFDPFRSGQPRARAEGLGLGLYIVQQLVIAHGGTVTVESTEAEGTTFRVCLPRG